MRSKERGIWFKVLPYGAECGDAPPYIKEKDEHADCLCGNRRTRCARDAQIQNQYGNRLKNDIDGKGNAQNDCRCRTVPEGTDKTVLQIEQKKYHQPRKDDGEKIHRPIENLRRSFHKDEQRPRQRKDECGQEKCCQHAEQDTRRCTAAHARRIVRAEALSRIDRDPRAEPHNKAEREEHETARTANGGKCIHPKESPDDERIDKRIELLHHISCNQRQRKEKDQPCGVTRRHILRHSRYLVTMVRSFS